MIIKEDINTTVTTTETTILKTSRVSSFFIINDGAQSITYKIYGSPVDIRVGDKKSNGGTYTQAEINALWEYVGITGTIASGVNKNVPIQSVSYQYFKLTAYTSSGTSSIRVYGSKISGYNFINDLTYLETILATKEEVTLAASGIKGAVSTYADLTSIAASVRATGLWIVNSDETHSGQGSLFSNNGVTYSYIAEYVVKASDLDTTTTDFNRVLSIADTDVQKALDTLDNFTVTPSSIDTLTNKTIDMNGSGNVISNIETHNFALNVVDTDATLASDSDTRLSTQKATKSYADTKIAIADIVDNLTSTDTNKPLSAKQGKTVNDALVAHVNNTSNPHSTTKAQVGLSDVDNVQQLPLSYLDTDGTLAANSNTKVSSQQATKTYADTKEPAFAKNTAFNQNFETSTSNIKMDGSVSVGALTTIARADHIHPSDTTKIDKATNVTSINDTGIADGEIALFNLTNKDIRTSDKTITTTLGTDDTTVPTSKAIKDYYEKDFIKTFLFMGA